MSSFIQLGSLSPKSLPPIGWSLLPPGGLRPHTHQDLAELQAVTPGTLVPQQAPGRPGLRAVRCQAGWPPASGSPDAMQPTPEQGKRIGVCKQYLKKKIAVQIQYLLTQVFIGGIIFPGLLSPDLLCKSQLTPAGTFLLGEGTRRKQSPYRLHEAGGQ